MEQEGLTELQHDLILRLRRIEGQARGVQRMVQEGRDCAEIVHQLAAMRAAVHGAGVLLLKRYARDCALKAQNDPAAESLDGLVELMLGYPGS